MSAQYTRNILKTYRSATNIQITAGKVWYSEARRIAAELTPHDPRIGAGILAATSPLTPWRRNIELARMCVANGGLTGGTLGNSIKAANRILNGEDPLDVLKSDKVRSFYCAIAGIEGDSIVIDRHAWAVAMNKPFTKDTAINRSTYRDMSTSYMNAAKREGIDGHSMQAICWVVYRESKGIVD